MVVKDWNIKEMTGYEPITTFYTDFSIADAFGEDAIRDTYKNAKFQCEHMGHEWLTELVMILNWKEWEHAEKHEKYCELYDELYFELRDYALNTLKDDELQYFFQTTD